MSRPQCAAAAESLNVTSWVAHLDPNINTGYGQYGYKRPVGCYTEVVPGTGETVIIFNSFRGSESRDALVKESASARERVCTTSTTMTATTTATRGAFYLSGTDLENGLRAKDCGADDEAVTTKRGCEDAAKNLDGFKRAVTFDRDFDPNVDTGHGRFGVNRPVGCYYEAWNGKPALWFNSWSGVENARAWTMETYGHLRQRVCRTTSNVL